MKIEKFCTLCKMKPNIKINKLNYCNVCFNKMIEMKCHKPLRKLPYKSRILLVLDENLSSIVLLKILSKYKNKNIHLFAINCVQNKQVFDDKLKEYDFPTLDQSNNDLKNERSISTIDTSNMNELRFEDLIETVNTKNPIELYSKIQEMCIDYVFFHSSVEDQGIKILTHLCNGENITNTVQSSPCFILNNRPIQFLNLFHEIKRKEILYYAFLHDLEIKFVNSEVRKTKLNSIIGKFIKKIDGDNSLALFNVLNTIKKL